MWRALHPASVFLCWLLLTVRQMMPLDINEVIGFLLIMMFANIVIYILTKILLHIPQQTTR